MLINPLPSVDSLAVKLLAVIFVFVSGLFTGHHLTAKLFEAKEQKALAAVAVKQEAIAAQGDVAVTKYVNSTKKLTNNLQATQQQIPRVFAKKETNEATTNCTVPRGFVRLFNNTATGSASAPDGSDADTTDVDLATVLQVITANNEKFNEVRDQLIELQQFESQATKK